MTSDSKNAEFKAMSNELPPRPKSTSGKPDKSEKSNFMHRTSSVSKLKDYAKSKAKKVTKGFVQKNKKKVRKSMEKEESSATMSSNTSPKSVFEESQNDNRSEADCSSYKEVTVYNVELEESAAGMERPVIDGEISVSSDKVDSEVVHYVENKDAVNLILLILDGRRFELLQLEMDIIKEPVPVVEEILKQIPAQSSDKSLRDAKYLHVCDKYGNVLDGGRKLSDYFSTYSAPDSKQFYVIMAVVEHMSVDEVVKYSKPIFSNSKISSFFEGFNEGTVATIGGSTNESETKDTQTTTSIEIQNTEKKNDKTSTKQHTKSQGVTISILSFMYLLINVFAWAYVRHQHISAPIGLNDTLSYGEYRSSCGILNFIPQFPPEYESFFKQYLNCKSKTILKLEEEGLLTLWKGDEILWQMNSKSKVCKTSQPSCTAELSGKGDVLIGGEVATLRTKRIVVNKDEYEESFLTWPFQNENHTFLKKLRKIIRKS